jgi:SAM-dependent methyltransferase
MNTAVRIERERQFWDTVDAGDYSKWQESTFDRWKAWPIRQQAMKYLGPLAGKKILVCSEGEEVIYFAREGAEVWCFDLSSARIKVLQALVDRMGLSDRVHLGVMPFEKLDYPDGFFDLAFGKAIVHHADLKLAGAELRRVLRPGGRASFVEPLGTNPIIAFARQRLPYRDKERTDDETPLDYGDIKLFGAAVGKLEYREFGLLGGLRRRIISNRAICDQLDRIDGVLLPALPFLGRFCAQVWIGTEA